MRRGALAVKTWDLPKPLILPSLPSKISLVHRANNWQTRQCLPIANDSKHSIIAKSSQTSQLNPIALPGTGTALLGSLTVGRHAALAATATVT